MDENDNLNEIAADVSADAARILADATRQEAPTLAQKPPPASPKPLQATDSAPRAKAHKVRDPIVLAKLGQKLSTPREILRAENNDAPHAEPPAPSESGGRGIPPESTGRPENFGDEGAAPTSPKKNSQKKSNPTTLSRREQFVCACGTPLSGTNKSAWIVYAMPAICTQCGTDNTNGLLANTLKKITKKIIKKVHPSSILNTSPDALLRQRLTTSIVDAKMRALFELMIQNPGVKMKEAMNVVGYAPGASPTHIIKRKNWQLMVGTLFSDDELEERERFLLFHDDPRMVNASLDRIHKIKGSFQHTQTNVNVNIDGEVRQMSDEKLYEIIDSEAVEGEITNEEPHANT